MTDAPDLRRWLDWLDTPDCFCPYEWKSIGRLDGAGMGKGWVRTDTDPDCHHHANPPSVIITGAILVDRPARSGDER